MKEIYNWDPNTRFYNISSQNEVQCEDTWNWTDWRFYFYIKPINSLFYNLVSLQIKFNKSKTKFYKLYFNYSI